MFNRKKEPVDIREIGKSSSKTGSFLPKSGSGFVDFTKKRMLPSEYRKLKEDSKKENTSSENISTFDFFDSPAPQQSVNSNSNIEELIRKISNQISDLDNKLYKMEQRIEVIEKKTGVGDSFSVSDNFKTEFGW